MSGVEDRALAASLAAELRRRPVAGDAFPVGGWDVLARAGVLAELGGGPAFTRCCALVRAASYADVSLGRLVDGHANALRRLALHVDAPVARADLAAAARGALRLGVWGADPAGGEGAPARIVPDGHRGAAIAGTKVFCSGAGGLQRAFVLARGAADGAPARFAYVDLTDPGTVTVDAAWFGAAGMRASVSHRVTFAGAPVLWAADAPDTLLAEPWLAQDGVCTAAGWVGGADRAVDEAVAAVRARSAPPGDADALAAAALSRRARGLGLWLEDAAARCAEHAEDAPAAGLLARAAIAEDAGRLLDDACRLAGSRALAAGGALERAAADLRLYVLQHRLDPALARLGHALLAPEAG